MERIDEIALKTTCLSCSAPPGDWCTTKSGNRATYLHADRTRSIEALYREGWVNGRESAENYVKNRTQQTHVDSLAGVIDRHLYGTPQFGSGQKIAHDVIAEGWRPTA